MVKGVISGKKRLTSIGKSVVLIIDKVFLNGSDIKSGDLIEFKIKKVGDKKECP